MASCVVCGEVFDKERIHYCGILLVCGELWPHVMYVSKFLTRRGFTIVGYLALCGELCHHGMYVRKCLTWRGFTMVGYIASVW